MAHLTENNPIPHVVFKTRIRDDSLELENPFIWKDLTTEEIFKGKKIVLFAAIGAFVPTGSETQLVGYEENYDEMIALGADEVICLSVNDAFVMFQWKKDLKIENVFMLPDGNADFTRAMGMIVKKTNQGLGERSWRYSMFVDDGVIKKMFVESGFADNSDTEKFEFSDAFTMLNYLKQELIK